MCVTQQLRKSGSKLHESIARAAFLHSAGRPATPEAVVIQNGEVMGLSEPHHFTGMTSIVNWAGLCSVPQPSRPLIVLFEHPGPNAAVEWLALLLPYQKVLLSNLLVISRG